MARIYRSEKYRKMAQRKALLKIITLSGIIFLLIVLAAFINKARQSAATNTGTIADIELRVNGKVVITDGRKPVLESQHEGRNIFYYPSLCFSITCQDSGEIFSNKDIYLDEKCNFNYSISLKGHKIPCHIQLKAQMNGYKNYCSESREIISGGPQTFTFPDVLMKPE
ncbi:MAG: hypothetical protein M1536_05530 [Firmicutes bacterium]|nr:hypothetical protein [Bacillota bacterium]